MCVCIMYVFMHALIYAHVYVCIQNRLISRLTYKYKDEDRTGRR